MEQNSLKGKLINDEVRYDLTQHVNLYLQEFLCVQDTLNSEHTEILVNVNVHVLVQMSFFYLQLF